MDVNKFVEKFKLRKGYPESENFQDIFGVRLCPLHDLEIHFSLGVSSVADIVDS